MNYSTYEGHVFDRLLVRLELGIILNPSKTRKKRMVLAECLNCSGNVKSYLLEQLKSGKTKSCGCLKTEITKTRFTKHGKSRSTIYKVWLNMKQRCLDSNHPAYKNYGGRGITVCQRWLDSFENFLADMGESLPNSQIDRINNNLGYSLENCRWATRSENNFNQRLKTNNKSGKTGVYWHKKDNKWVSQIKAQGQQKHLGSFENIEDAIEARKQAELEFFGYTKE